MKVFLPLVNAHIYSRTLIASLLSVFVMTLNDLQGSFELLKTFLWPVCQKVQCMLQITNCKNYKEVCVMLWLDYCCNFVPIPLFILCY